MKNELHSVDISPQACKQQESLPKIMVTFNETLNICEKNISATPKHVKFSKQETLNKQLESQPKKVGKKSPKVKSKTDTNR